MPTNDVPLRERPRPCTSQGVGLLLASAETLMLDGLGAVVRQEPDLEVAATVTTGEQAVAAASTVAPDVVVFDPELHDQEGQSLCTVLPRQRPHLRTLALTARAEPEVVHTALGAGVDSYVLKQVRAATLIEAIRRTAVGDTVMSSELAYALLTYQPTPDSAEIPLTAREQQVLTRIADGESTRMIASRYRISMRTVQKHVEGLFSKLGVTDRTRLVVEASRRGLI